MQDEVERLTSQLNNIAENLDGRVGLSVRVLPDDIRLDIDGDGVYAMASVFKIPILVELFSQAEAGKLNLSERVRLDEREKVAGSGVLPEMQQGLNPTLLDLATLMIIVSDNTATDLLLSRVGQKHVDKRLRGLGLQVTCVNASCTELLARFAQVKPEQLDYPQQLVDILNQRRQQPPEERPNTSARHIIRDHIDVSTPREMTRLLYLLETGALLCDDLTDKALEILRAQKLTSRIPALLPEGARVAHKTGTLFDVVCDAGIMYPPAWINSSRRAIITVFTADVSDRRKATRTIAELSRAVYDHYLA